ncbi:hypothetical protein JOQ06_021789, partial [Pogonophryne albipinna]
LKEEGDGGVWKQRDSSSNASARPFERVFLMHPVAFGAVPQKLWVWRVEETAAVMGGKPHLCLTPAHHLSQTNGDLAKKDVGQSPMCALVCHLTVESEASTVGQLRHITNGKYVAEMTLRPCRAGTSGPY